MIHLLRVSSSPQPDIRRTHMTTQNKPSNTTDTNKWSNTGTGSTPNQPGKTTNPGDTRKQSTIGDNWSQKDQWQKGPTKNEKGWDVRGADAGSTQKSGKTGTSKNK